MEIVHVTWKDTGILENWNDIGTVCAVFNDVGTRIHDTAGFLLFDNEEWMAIANGWNSATGSAMQVHIIPQSAVIHMEVQGYAEVIPNVGDEKQEGTGAES